MDKESELNPRQNTLVVFLMPREQPDVDPIRIMKGLFLFGMETPADWLPAEARYDFVPYDYGPCSFTIYSDLNALSALGYVTGRSVPGQSWRYYSLTDKGTVAAQTAVKTMDANAVAYLRAIRDFVSRLSFRELLAAVYDRYPDYAVNSVFKRSIRGAQA